jgi:uncharacterized membrane protein YhaH (DUF805 family)
MGACRRGFGKVDGRAGRAEFWWWQLTEIVVFVVLRTLPQVAGPLFAIPFLIFIPIALGTQLAVSGRRLHDTGRSAWWLLLILVPLLGGVALLVLCALPGSAGANRFGPPPGGGRGPGFGPGPGFPPADGGRPASYFGIGAPPAAPAEPYAVPEPARPARPEPGAARRLGAHRAYGPMPRPEAYRPAPRGPRELAR